MREIFKSGSVRGLIVTSGPLPQTRGALWALLDMAGYLFATCYSSMAQPKIPVKCTRRLLFFAPSRLCVIVFQFNAKAGETRRVLSISVFTSFASLYIQRTITKITGFPDSALEHIRLSDISRCGKQTTRHIGYLPKLALLWFRGVYREFGLFLTVFIMNNTFGRMTQIYSGLAFVKFVYSCHS